MTELERQRDVILGRIERLSGKLAMKHAIHGLGGSDDSRRAIEELEAAVAIERVSLGNVVRAIARGDQQ